MSVLLISINVKRLKNIFKHKAIFYFVRNKRKFVGVFLFFVFFFLPDTHTGTADEHFWEQQWGDKTFFSDGTSHSAGVMMLFNRLPGKVIVHKSDVVGHWLMVVVEMH